MAELSPVTVNRLHTRPDREVNTAPETLGIIAVCGSMRHWEYIEKASNNLKRLGYVVLTPINFGTKLWDDNDATFRGRLRDDFLKKIDACNILYVVNKGGYIGEDTRKEIEYAMKRKKRIEYMEAGAPEIITICGSRRFKDDIMRLASLLEGTAERLVFTPEIFKLEGNRIEHLTGYEHDAYDKLHEYKMQISTYILIFDKDGYIGEDTRREVEYAKMRDMNIHYFSKREDLQNQLEALNAINTKLGI